MPEQKIPTLEDLKTKELTLPEIQAALANLIDLHNKLNNAINDLIDSGQILSKSNANNNKRYGL